MLIFKFQANLYFFLSNNICRFRMILMKNHHKSNRIIISFSLVLHIRNLRKCNSALWISMNYAKWKTHLRVPNHFNLSFLIFLWKEKVVEMTFQWIWIHNFQYVWIWLICWSNFRYSSTENTKIHTTLLYRNTFTNIDVFWNMSIKAIILFIQMTSCIMIMSRI